MDSSDIATIVLSSVALLVSIATLFLTFLYKKAALIGCLASVTTPEVTSRDDCDFEFALSNTGTLELLVREVSIDLAADSGELIPDVSPSTLPVVIKAGQVQLLRVGVPNLFLRKVAKKSQTMTFRFEVFSSRGTVYLPETTFTPKMADYVTSEAAWQPFVLGKSVHRPVRTPERRIYRNDAPRS